MKAQILKITGVKSDKEFYKLFPNTPEGEKAFMAKYGKEFKKAQMGAMIDSNKNGIPDAVEDPYNLSALNNPGFGQTANYGDTAGYATPMQDQRQYQAQYDNAIKRPQLTAVSSITPMGSTNPLATGNVNGNSAFDVSTLGTQGSSADGGFNVPGAMNFIGGFANAVKGIKAAEEQTKKLQTWAGVSGVVKDAAISNAFVQKQPNEYYRPDELKNVANISELYRGEGRGSDAITQNGGSVIGGNDTEIQNMYSDDYTIYTDLEDADDVKSYQNGGNYAPFLSGSALGQGGLFGGDTSGGSFLASAMGGNSSWANAASLVPGPLGMGLTMAAQFLDPNPGRQRNAQNTINSNQAYINRINMGGGIQKQFSANVQNGGDLVEYEEGGYMNPEYNPQLITMFGDQNADDFADYANKYRAGGNLKEYTSPSERAMQTYENGGEMSSYAMGGKVQTYGQGKVVDESYNPYMPGSGISSMIKGPSHKNGGVKISYGGEAQNGYGYAANGANMEAQIEAEGGEPMMEMAEGGEIDSQTGEQKTNAVVIGNIPAKYEVLSLISDNEDFLNYVKKKGNNGRTMKSLFDQITKEEIAATKAKEKSSKIANNAGKDKFGKLDLQTAKTIEDAGDLSLQLIANTKMGFANAQDSLHKIKGEISKGLGYNISAEDLGRGKIKKDFDPITKDATLDDVAKSGAYLRKAQNSTTINPDDYDTNIIKNIQDVLNIDPKTPGYGTVFGPRSNKSFREWQKINMPDNYAENVKNYGKNYSLNKKDLSELSDKNLGNQTKQKLGLTPEGYKYIGKDKQAEVTTAPSNTQTNEGITQKQYDDFVKKYESSQSTKGKANKDTLDFQKLYHKAFPQEALAAIQKTTKENGLSNKAKQMGLTKEDIASGKNINKILQSNEDQYHGPRTDQYMASVRSKFSKTPPAADIQLNNLGEKVVTTGGDTTKSPIGIVPLKNNNAMDAIRTLGQLFQNKQFPDMDPRQFAGEYVAAAQNTPEPVPMQKPYVELDPLYRMSYQDVRNASTSSFRDAMRMNQFDPAAAASIFGRKAEADQQSYADEFRTNQAIEQQIFGGNRAKMNANQYKGLELNANQANLQSIVNSKTKEINQKIASSFADKNMKYEADKNKFLTASNLFPTYGYGANYQTQVQGPGYKPVIPQIYGGESTIQQVPVYKNGVLDHYEMVEGDGTTTETTTLPPGIVANKKNGGSVVKNAKNSSVVKAYKNL